MGAETGSGSPYIAFNAGPGTSGNTYKTLGLLGTVIKTDTSGNLRIGRLTTASADNQTPVESAVFTNSGNLQFPSGQGIDFSPTAGTGTSELLDDYEEGTWTPNLLNGTSITYTTTPTGNYTKIGNMVHVTASIDVSNSDTADGSAVTIGGLPFNAIDNSMTLVLGRYRGFLGAKGSVALGASANASFIQIYESNNNFIVYSEIASSGLLYFSGTYLT
jgi:hypothetical protein